MAKRIRISTSSLVTIWHTSTSVVLTTPGVLQFHELTLSLLLHDVNCHLDPIMDCTDDTCGFHDWEWLILQWHSHLLLGHQPRDGFTAAVAIDTCQELCVLTTILYRIGSYKHDEQNWFHLNLSSTSSYTQYTLCWNTPVADITIYT